MNDWLEARLIAWDDTCQSVIEDWIRLNERPQPPAEIRRFEKLTGRKYPPSTSRPGVQLSKH